METVDALPKELQLFSMVLHMWTKSISVSLAMVKAVLLCRLVLSRVDPLTGGERSSKKLESLLSNSYLLRRQMMWLGNLVRNSLK